MHLELKTCFKLLERAQWARGSAGGRRRAWRPRAEAGVAWRVWKKAAGRIKAAAVRGATCGVCGEQEVALVRLQRRRAVAKSGSGRWQAAWQDGERPAGFGEAAALGLRRHVAQRRAARGRRCTAHGRAQATGRRRDETEEPGWRKKTRTAL
jgi:hypothetical protein